MNQKDKELLGEICDNVHTHPDGRTTITLKKEDNGIRYTEMVQVCIDMGFHFISYTQPLVMERN